MKKKVIIKKVIIMGGILFFLSLIRIYQINSIYPDPQIVTYSQGEEIQGGDIKITVTESRLDAASEVTKNIDGYQDPVAEGCDLPSEQCKILLVKLLVQNTSEEIKTVDLTRLVAQSNSWSNGWDLELFYLMNDFSEMGMELDGFAEKNFYLGFHLYDFQFNRNEWNDVDKRGFYLVFSVYPYKNQVYLNTRASFYPYI